MKEDIGRGKFKFIGGNSAVDFINTVGGWTHRPPNVHQIGYRDVVTDDKLKQFGDLLSWGIGAGIITDSESFRLTNLANRLPLAAEEVLDRAVRLRRAIYRILISKDSSRVSFANDLLVLNGELALARSRQRLIPSGKKYELGWQLDDSLDRVLWPIAVAAAKLLAEGELARLRQCGGPDCGWLFLDTSRNHSRIWCDMKDCGNVAKVRRFRERHEVN